MSIRKFEPVMGEPAPRCVEIAQLGPRDLVKGARAGDGEAFAALVEPYLGQALTAATLIVGSKDDAADVVQDALVSAWTGLRRLRDPDAFAAWFRTQVVRAAWKAARRQRGHRRPTDVIPDPIDRIEKGISERRLQRAFVTLDAEDRMILTLRFHLGLSTNGTAEQLGIPAGTVKSRVHAAVRRLRAAYDAEDRS
jgi:RNA polymerase sigma-70 factor (ECF subfamily)